MSYNFNKSPNNRAKGKNCKQIEENKQWKTLIITIIKLYIRTMAFFLSTFTVVESK